jgi:hypothetical protein
MFTMPYDTRIGKDMPTGNLVKGLIRARANNHVVADSSLLQNVLGLPESEGLPIIYFVNEKWQDVEFFTQVISTPHEWKANELIYYIDVRQQTTVGKDGVLKFKSSNDKLFTLIRVLLTVEWSQGTIHPFYSSVEGASLVYCQWVVRAIAKTFPLTPASQVRISILAGIFFRSLFMSNDAPSLLDSSNTRTKAVFATQISAAARAPVDMCVDMLERVGGYIRDVESFCKAVSEHSENVALETMSVARLFNSLPSTWFGANAGEHAACALEYPPTFYAMVLTSMKDNSYRKTVIGEIVKDNMSNKNIQLLASTFKKYTDL